jgi:FkbM family methyltransferase
MKYFLDFGTHMFEGLDEFIIKLGIDTNYIVFCYEPNKTVFEKSKSIISKYDNKFHSLIYVNLAIMDYTGTITFNEHKGVWKNFSKTEYITDYTTGSNCLEINPKYDAYNGVVFDSVSDTVGCIDVNEIFDSIVKNDNNAEIYIKCDIEGSEFKVLPRLLSSNNIKMLKKIYIEWHERFWHGSSDFDNKCIEKNNIINEFNRLNIECFTHT